MFPIFRLQGYKLFSCSTQLSMKFQLHIKTKMLKNKDSFDLILSVVVITLLINVKMQQFIPVRSHTFVEIDHEMISTSFSSLPLIHSRRVVVSYK